MFTEVVRAYLLELISQLQNSADDQERAIRIGLDASGHFLTGEDASIASLISLLGDTNPHVVILAVLYLGMLSQDELDISAAYEPVTALVNSPIYNEGKVLAAAMTYTLALLGDTRVLQGLAGFKEDINDTSVRRKLITSVIVGIAHNIR